jgi:hypothetical protein
MFSAINFDNTPPEEEKPLVTNQEEFASKIAKEITFISTQSSKQPSNIEDDQIYGSSKFKKLEKNVDIPKADFGYTNRLFSDIQKVPIKDIFRISEMKHSFDIKNINYSDETGKMSIWAEEYTMTHKTSAVKIGQSATYDIKTGEIYLRLFDISQEATTKKSLLLYESRYKVNNMYKDNANISLDSYTKDEKKNIKQNNRIQTVLKKLDGKIVNIYSYLNSNSDSYDKNVAIFLTSTLDELKIKFENVKKNITYKLRSASIQEKNLAEMQNAFVTKVLENNTSLENYKLDLQRWHTEYNKWSTKTDTAYDIEDHQYMLEFVKTGKSRISQYNKHLIDRMNRLDSRANYTKSTEKVVDYTKTEEAEREIRKIRNDIKAIQSNLKRATATNNKTEIKRFTDDLKAIAPKAKLTKINLMTVDKDIYTLEDEFGLYRPYLLSDMLRYGSSFWGDYIIDVLSLTDKNIDTFAAFVNSFKSLVFTIVSLHQHLMYDKITTSCVPGTIQDSTTNKIRTEKNKEIIERTKMIIDFKYYLSLYPKLKNDNKELPIIENTYPKYIMFKPCATEVQDLLSVLKNKPSDSMVPLRLLSVDEPLFGPETIRSNIIEDFDEIYSKGESLAENFITLAREKYDYEDDIIGVDETEEFAFVEDDFPDLLSSGVKVVSKKETSATTNAHLFTVIKDAAEKKAIEDGEDIETRQAREEIEDRDREAKVAREREAREAREAAAREAKEIKEKAAREAKAREAKRKDDMWKTSTSEISTSTGDMDEDALYAATFQPSIKAISTPASNSLTFYIGDREVEYFPISEISESGKVQLVTGHTHPFGLATQVSFNRLKGQSLDWIAKELVRIQSTADPLTVYNQNTEILKVLNTATNIPLVSVDQKSLKLDLKKSTLASNKNITKETKDKKVDFILESDKKIRKLYIESGGVFESIDNGLVKDVRDTSKDARDKHVPSTTQFEKTKEEYENLQKLKKLGFGSIDEYLRAKLNEEIESIHKKIWEKLTKSKEFKSRIGKDKDDILEESIKEKIAKLRADKDTNGKGHKIFELLTIDELFKIIVFYLNHPENNKSIRELFTNLYQLDLPPTTESLHERIINIKQATTNGTMFTAVNDWESKLNSTDKSKREKYLKYKAKYLALKAKLGM